MKHVEGGREQFSSSWRKKKGKIKRKGKREERQKTNRKKEEEKEGKKVFYVLEYLSLFPQANPMNLYAYVYVCLFVSHFESSVFPWCN